MIERERAEEQGNRRGGETGVRAVWRFVRQHLDHRRIYREGMEREDEREGRRREVDLLRITIQ